MIAREFVTVRQSKIAPVSVWDQPSEIAPACVMVTPLRTNVVFVSVEGRGEKQISEPINVAFAGVVAGVIVLLGIATELARDQPSLTSVANVSVSKRTLILFKKGLVKESKFSIQNYHIQNVRF